MKIKEQSLLQYKSSDALQLQLTFLYVNGLKGDVAYVAIACCLEVNLNLQVLLYNVNLERIQFLYHSKIIL